MYGSSHSDLRPMTEEAAGRWVGRLLDHDHAWIMEADMIGHVRLDRVDLSDKRASLAIGIDDGSQLGKGLGSEAVALVLGYDGVCRTLLRFAHAIAHRDRQALGGASAKALRGR
jgi:hypothetical protein